MEKRSFQVQPDGTLTIAARQIMAGVIKLFAGERIVITVEKWKSTRSKNQNNFYWGFVVPPIKRAFFERGTILSADDTHKIIVGSIWKHTKAIEMPDGSMQEIIDTSTNLDPHVWEGLLDATRAYFSKWHVQIPYPNEKINYDDIPPYEGEYRE